MMARHEDLRHRPPLRGGCLLAALVVALATQACRDSGSRRTGSESATVPERVISTVPAVTEMLFAIGAGSRVVGVSSFDTWPEAVRTLPRVGGLLDPDLERIIGLRPDLVVVYGTQSDMQTQLQRSGIRTFPYTHGGLDGVTRTMRQLGDVLGVESEAQRAASAIENRLAAVGRRVSGQRRPRTLLVFGREPGTLRAIDASGGIGFLHDIIRVSGGDNVFGHIERESLRVSVESVMAAAPDVVIELLYGPARADADLERERRVWDAIPAVPAVRTGRVVLLSGDLFVVPGPRLVEAAERIADALHPSTRR